MEEHICTRASESLSTCCITGQRRVLSDWLHHLVFAAPAPQDSTRLIPVRLCAVTQFATCVAWFVTQTRAHGTSFRPWHVPWWAWLASLALLAYGQALNIGVYKAIGAALSFSLRTVLLLPMCEKCRRAPKPCHSARDTHRVAVACKIFAPTQDRMESTTGADLARKSSGAGRSPFLWCPTHNMWGRYSRCALPAHTLLRQSLLVLCPLTL